MFLLDSNTCIHLLRRSHEGVVRAFMAQPAAKIAVCSIVKAELDFGARRSRRPDYHLTLLDAFFEPLTSLPFDDSCAQAYGQIRADLATQGRQIGPNDLLIAAIARTHDVTLVTHNTREFSRVAGLKLVDWEAEG